ncbi:hypothetical protein BB560_007280 [Smittium megazygosporum]|uniref:chitin synthase n=1 Tax=Smittium megazygosporum TaxID=133381 RepID=A0A2T9XXB7_9FUNG|nr:hypothetical protein BB560_007280 [Smittium megazygosporum]
MYNEGLQPQGNTLRRNRTLFRAERLSPEAPLLSGKKSGSSAWVIFSRAVTILVPGWALEKMAGLGTPEMRQAWREKVSLCFIIVLICGVIVFLTLCLSPVFCPGSVKNVQYNLAMINKEPGVVGIFGKSYQTSQARFPGGFNPTPGQDITYYFNRPLPSSCLVPSIQKFRAVYYDPCSASNGVGGCPLGDINSAIQNYNLVPLPGRPIGFDWSDVKPGLFVVNGEVVDLTTYLNSVNTPDPKDPLDQLIFNAAKTKGSDGTISFLNNPELKLASKCILDKYRAGLLSKSTPGCFGVVLYNYIALIIIMLIVFIRFFMALVFKYFISWKLVARPSRSRTRPISYNAAAPWNSKYKGPTSKRKSISRAASDELYTVMLVTCYSESYESIKGTCDSLASTDYSANRKVLFIVADGIITGSGNSESTPDICISLIDQEEEFLNPEPSSYIAVASGSKKYNEAKVYCGYYKHDGPRVPAIVVVKCGGPNEQNAPKPGNRGKRDSQIILMGFFSRVIYNDRLCPLDYDLFRKVQHLTGATPDLFEIVLMVDADTKVYPDSLRLLVNCLNNDHLIMGICGETRIANKRQSWVTAIQVYEYYISHHLGKAFESVFGGVTCLPGCFCMYRLKARKGNDWVPILTKPEILQDYSQSVVETLHEKNLLLLGEDRFLTTLMLRNFPSRKMMFMPQAVCKTMVPDEFKVLLSQRRRWINSTIHNLMELILVRDLCGTFCLSMQFSIFLDLVGTVSLPIAIFLTFLLIIQVVRSTYTTFSSYLPLAMLLIVLFLPSLIVVFTSRKYVYLMWLVVYLFALPIWNFVLPVYAYWHFDDFSWGETRKVSGETKDTGHGNDGGEFDSRSVPLKRWEDYERRRIRKNRNRTQANDQYDQQDDYYNSTTFLNDSESTRLIEKNSSFASGTNDYQYYSHPQNYNTSSPQVNDYGSNYQQSMQFPQQHQQPPHEYELQTFNDNGNGYNTASYEPSPYVQNTGSPNQLSNSNSYNDGPTLQSSPPLSQNQQRKKPSGARVLKRN